MNHLLTETEELITCYPCIHINIHVSSNLLIVNLMANANLYNPMNCDFFIHFKN